MVFTKQVVNLLNTQEKTLLMKLMANQVNNPEENIHMKKNYTADVKTCGLCSMVGIVQVHKISVMPYGLRWALNFYDADGTTYASIKKYSNFRYSEQGWKQFLSEMRHIGYEFPATDDKATTAETVALVCSEGWYVAKVNQDDNGIGVIFLRNATFRECLTRRVALRTGRLN